MATANSPEPQTEPAGHLSPAGLAVFNVLPERIWSAMPPHSAPPSSPPPRPPGKLDRLEPRTTFPGPHTCGERATLGPSFQWIIRVMLTLFVTADLAKAVADEDTQFTDHARQVYELAAARLAEAPTNQVAGWEFARACFELAEFSTNATQRATLAQQGIAAGRRVLESAPNSPGGNYYLAMNLGQLARTKLLGALKLVGEMERLFLRTIELDPAFDFAGPHRCLGLLYLNAPGWPTSIGNRKKARTHLERAVELSPDHPENRLNLLEAQIKWGMETTARSSLEPTAAVLRSARTRLLSERWQARWAGWERRWRTVQLALGVTNPTDSKGNSGST